MKRIATFNIEDKVLVLFNKKAKENAINKSQWIQLKMEEFIEEVKK